MNGAPGWADGVVKALSDRALQDPQRAASGLLVGSLVDERPRIEGIIPITERRPAGVPPIDHAQWGWAHEALGTFYGGRSILGWYSAQPGLAAAVTEEDVDTHRRFFSTSTQILVCIDPSTGVAAGYVPSASGMVAVYRGVLDVPVAPQPQQATSGLAAPALLGIAAGTLLWLLMGVDGGLLQ